MNCNHEIIENAAFLCIIIVGFNNWCYFWNIIFYYYSDLTIYVFGNNLK